MITTTEKRDDTKRERTVAFIVARLSSSRLPAKHLRLIGDRPMVQWTVDRLHDCKELDEIVLATVDEPENLPLKDFAGKNGLSCFWYAGDVDHVTTRLRRAAEAFKADICVLVSGDCPLIYAPAIDEMIRCLKGDLQADTVRLPADVDGRPPALQGVVVSRIKAWQLADDLADRPELKEHQFPVIGLQPERFRPLDVRLPDRLYMPHHRLSVDTLADLAFMNRLYADLNKTKRPFELPDVVALVRDREDLRAINAHVHQCRLVENKKRVLFIVDAGSSYGYGHLMRSMELARQITERLAWPAHFVIDDHPAKAMIEEMGAKTHWGAFGRPANRNGRAHQPTFEDVISAYDLLVFDIFDQRDPGRGWRSAIGRGKRCIVIENLRPWTEEADLRVLPNILNAHQPEVADGDSASPAHRSTPPGPRVIGGEEYIILRDEIRQLASIRPQKEIDVLLYLHDHRLAMRFMEKLESMSMNAKATQGFNSGFASNLARARVFVSGFGISFYEALALETLPVCCPDSRAHKKDAIRFYEQLGMPALIVESPAGLEEVTPAALNNRIRMPASIQDGTSNIVAQIAALFECPAP